MAEYIVSGVAPIEAGDALSAWHHAHREARHLRWEVVGVVPANQPNRAVRFATALESRGQVRRRIATGAVFVAALLFPPFHAAAAVASLLH